METEDAIVRFAERMLKRHPFQKLSVLWFGGEPLLGLDIIERLSAELTALAKAHGVKYSAEIITNGYLLDARAIDVLSHAGVVKAQITLDGIGKTHDKTRCLVNGEGTFERIVGNIRKQKIPFEIDIRHNVMHDNRSEEEPLRNYVEKLAEESGNTIHFYAIPVFESEAAEKRHMKVSVLKEGEDREYVYRDAYERFISRSEDLCEAAKRYSITIGPDGSLYACGEKAGDSSEMTANIRDYDPDHSEATAIHPKISEYYLNTDLLFDRCGDCVFLPRCLGECPAKRRKGVSVCPDFKNDPDSYVLHIYRELKAKSKKKG